MTLSHDNIKVLFQMSGHNYSPTVAQQPIFLRDRAVYFLVINLS